MKGTFAGIFGFSDDDIAKAPSFSALESMMKIIEEFNEEHGLRFSTDPNPAKSKTKCIAWLNVKRTLSNIILSGNLTPWVEKIRHLGNTITNNSNTMAKDMEEKKAKYIAKCNEIIQEFSFASAKTKFKLNSLYNISWYGSALWDLSLEEFIKIVQLQ